MSGVFDLRQRRVLVTGGGGFLGGHLLEALRRRGVPEASILAPSRREADLLRLEDSLAACEGRDVIFHLAARVGGIAFNLREPARILYENAVMSAHVIEAARRCGAGRFVAVGSVCAYPVSPPVPTREDHLYEGKPEASNLAYGQAKRLLHTAVEAYRAQHGMSAIYVLPANLYGPGDHFDPEDAHVIPALVRRFVDAAGAGAPSVAVWGDGRSTREFLYAADCAEAIVRAAELYDDGSPLNLGSGREISIRDLAGLIAKLAGFEGRIAWETSRPSGQRRRCYDTSRSVALLGPYATTSLEDGLAETIRWYRDRVAPEEPRVR